MSTKCNFSAREATLCKKKAIALSFAFYDRDVTPSKVNNACNMGNWLLNMDT